MSFGFLESQTPQLETPIFSLIFSAYLLRLLGLSNQLQGCLDYHVPEKCLFAYSELISDYQCISFCKYVYNTYIDIFYLSLLSMELNIGLTSLHSIQVKPKKA